MADFPTKVMIGQKGKGTDKMARFSYANVFVPKAMNANSPEKYSVSIIIPKSDKETLAKIKKAIEAAKIAGKAKVAKNGKIPTNLKTPLRDGDEDRPDDEAYADAYFINANSNKQPGIVDENRQAIISADEFYSGCYGRCTVNFYAYSSNGSKGIAAGLQNLQKLADGERLGGGASAEEDFADDFGEDEDFM